MTKCLRVALLLITNSIPSLLTSRFFKRFISQSISDMFLADADFIRESIYRHKRNCFFIVHIVVISTEVMGGREL